MRQSFYLIIRRRESGSGTGMKSLEEEVLGERIGKIALKSFTKAPPFEGLEGDPKTGDFLNSIISINL